MSSGSRTSSKGKERAAGVMDTPAAASILSPLMDQLLAAGLISKPLDASNWDPHEASKLESCLSTMLAKLNSSQQDLSRLMDKHRGLASDFDRMEQAQLKRRQTLEASEYEKEHAKAKASASAKELATEQARHTQAKEEIHKARLALASVKQVAQHDSKRRENEVASIMARWQKVSSSSTSVQHSAIILNTQESISRSEVLSRSKGSGRETPSGITLLEESLQRADDEKHAMQEENIHLREVMGDVLNEVKATLSSINVEVPALCESLDDPLIHVTSLHLALSPNEIMDYLSKLLLTLRDATLSALHESEQAVTAAQALASQEAMNKITDLETSLSVMQADLDAARLEVKEVNELYESARLTKSAGEADALTKAKLERQEAKKAKGELEESKRLYRELKVQYEREKAARLEAKSSLDSLQSELTSLKRRATDEEASVDAPSSKRRRGASNRGDDVSLESTSAAQQVETVPGRQANRRTMRQSTTSAALKDILASTTDTPPNRPAPLSSKPTNSQLASHERSLDKERKVVVAKSDANYKTMDDNAAAPSSAALAAKDRIYRAVEAAKARNGAGTRASNVTQHRK